MSRRLISAALGLALAASTSFGASAATTPTALVSALTGQPGVSADLVAAAGAVSGACAASSTGAACLAALQTLLSLVPANLSASLTGEVTELVSTTVASRTDIAADPALSTQLASLSQSMTSLGGSPLTGATGAPGGAPAGTLPDSGAGAGGGGGGTPITGGDTPASPGAAG